MYLIHIKSDLRIYGLGLFISSKYAIRKKIGAISRNERLLKMLVSFLKYFIVEIQIFEVHLVFNNNNNNDF